MSIGWGGKERTVEKYYHRGRTSTHRPRDGMMRILLLGILLATRVVLDRPWQYTWAFGQDAGAARSADWKHKPCTNALAATRYDDDNGDAKPASKWGNRFFIPGTPGHTYYEYRFRSHKGCELVRTTMGAAQWDQPELGSVLR